MSKNSVKTKDRGVKRLLVSLPPDLAEWYEQQAAQSFRSRNMQIVSALEKQKRIVERAQEQA